MELTQSHLQPEIGPVLDLAAVVGIRTIVLLCTCIADASGRAIANRLAQRIPLDAQQMISFRAFPAIKAGIVTKACQFVTARPAMRVHGQFFESCSDAQQKNGVA